MTTTARQRVTGAATPPVVLFLIHDLRLGGAERALISYVNHFRRVRPVVVVLRPRGDLLDELDPAVPVFDLACPAIPATGDHRDAFHGGEASHVAPGAQAVQGWSDDIASLARKTMRLRAILDHSGARAISTFLHKSHVLALALKLTLDRRTRVIANVHELLSSHLHHHHGRRDRVLLRQFVRRGFPRMERIVAVSEGVRQDLVRAFAIPATRVVVLNNPLDRERIRRRAAETVDLPLPVAREGALLVAVGRLVRLKGFDVLLRAFARLRADLAARLIIVGDGEERASLESLIAELSLGGRVALVGQQMNPWKYLARADVVVLSSRTEAFPSVLGEAMTLARPIIATDCSPGVRDYLDHGRCGLLVPSDDERQLAAAMERVITDGSLRERLGAAGRARVRDMDLPSAVRRYEDMLLELHGADA